MSFYLPAEKISWNKCYFLVINYFYVVRNFKTNVSPRACDPAGLRRLLIKDPAWSSPREPRRPAEDLAEEHCLHVGAHPRPVEHQTIPAGEE